MKNGINEIKEIIKLFEEITEDIDNLYEKDYLITSIVSNIKNNLDLPNEFIRKTIELIFLADNL